MTNYVYTRAQTRKKVEKKVVKVRPIIKAKPIVKARPIAKAKPIVKARPIAQVRPRVTIRKEYPNTRASLRIQIQAPETQYDPDTILRAMVERKFGGSRALSCIPEPWKFTKVIGEGSFGRVCQIKYGRLTRAVKFQKGDAVHTSYEVTLQHEFSKSGLSPTIQHYDTWGPQNQFSLIIMDEIDSTVDDYLEKRRTKEELDTLLSDINTIIKKMCKLKLRHGDAHWKNLGFIGNKVVLLDFGFASLKQPKCLDTVEWYQMLRTLGPSFSPSFNQSNRDYLVTQISKIIRMNAKKDGFEKVLKHVNTYKGLTRHFDVVLTKNRPNTAQVKKVVSSKAVAARLKKLKCSRK